MSTNFKDVKDFHKKFNFTSNSRPTELDQEKIRGRIAFMFEELIEFVDASGAYWGIDRETKDVTISYPPNPTVDMAEQADALIDLVYVAMGTAVQMGLPWQELWDDVHRANMAKERGMTSRGISDDAIKPDGWQGPKTNEILNRARNLPVGLIIIDGPDGCGKTTLAEKLVEMYNGTYIHHTWSPELQTQMDTYLTNGLELAIEESRNRLVIVDRLWMSEICYSEGIREGTEYPDLHAKLASMVQEENGLNIVCFPDDIEKGLARFERLKGERPEHYDNIAEVFDVYGALWHGHRYEYKNPTGFTSAMKYMPLNCRTEFVRYDMELYELEDLEDYCVSLIDQLSIIQEA